MEWGATTGEFSRRSLLLHILIALLFYGFFSEQAIIDTQRLRFLGFTEILTRCMELSGPSLGHCLPIPARGWAGLGQGCLSV